MQIPVEHICIGILFAVVIWQARKIREVIALASLSITLQRHHVSSWANGQKIMLNALEAHAKRLDKIDALLDPAVIEVDMTDDPIFDEDGFEIEPTLN